MTPVPVMDALLAAVLFAADPPGLGGIRIKAHAGPVRDLYLDFLKSRLSRSGTIVRKLPLNIQDDRLLGGLDLAATLNSGRPVLAKGLLAEACGGVVMIPMAERLSVELISRLTAVMDQGEVTVARDGISAQLPARFGLVLLDESVADDERVSPLVLDRMAFQVDLTSLTHADMQQAVSLFEDSLFDEQDVLAKSAASEVSSEIASHAARVESGDEVTQALCAAALMLGIDSFRAALLALRVARVHARFHGRSIVADEDAQAAARLVLGPRATQIPASESMPDEPAPDEPNSPPEQPDDQAQEASQHQEEDPSAETSNQQIKDPLDDVVLEAAKAAIPAGLLAALAAGNAGLARSASSGKSGALRKGGARGRPVGSRAGAPSGKSRLNVIDTLRAAAPWQRLRRAAQPSTQRVIVKPQDFQVTRFKQRTETTAIFVVDASGSSALHRLAEVKGAIELLLADCYVRRDQVAVIAFRGKAAELILPPTRSLVRAKRSLSGLPGGGGTPLAQAIEASVQLAQSVARKGDTPVIVMLTDAKANIARDGQPGRQQAQEDATQAARQIRAAGYLTLLIDTSPSPSALAQALAVEMSAHYLPLPHAGAAQVSEAVKRVALR